MFTRLPKRSSSLSRLSTPSRRSLSTISPRTPAEAFSRRCVNKFTTTTSSPSSRFHTTPGPFAQVENGRIPANFLLHQPPTQASLPRWINGFGGRGVVDEDAKGREEGEEVGASETGTGGGGGGGSSMAGSGGAGGAAGSGEGGDNGGKGKGKRNPQDGEVTEGKQDKETSPSEGEEPKTASSDEVGAEKSTSSSSKDGSSTTRKPGRPASSGNSSSNRASASSAGSSSTSSGSSSSSSSSSSPSGSLSLPSVPATYPQVLALPIARRPLFPGFYKAVVVKNAAVVGAIKEMMRRGQPYLGAFLMKDEEGDSDVITDPSQVHEVGVFAQITSVFPATPNAPGPASASSSSSSGKDKEKEQDKEGGKDSEKDKKSSDSPIQQAEALTVVLYPHRRVRITEIIPPRKEKEGVEKVVQEARGEEGLKGLGSEVAADDIKVEEVKESDEGASTTEPTSIEEPTRVDDVEVPGVKESSSVETPTTDKLEGDRPATPLPSQEVDTTEGQQTAKPEAGKEKRRPGRPRLHPTLQTAFLQDYAVSLANINNLEMSLTPTGKPIPPSAVSKAIASEIINVFKEIAQLNPLFRDQIANFSMSSGANNVFEEPDKLADFAAAVSTGEIQELQGVLESMDLEDRLQKALVVLKRELYNAQIQNKISKDVDGKIAKRQREYYLMEQLKGIKKELGLESDGKDKLVEKFREKAKTLNMPEEAKKIFEEELNKIQHLEPAASEFNVTRNYLDWLTQIPWGRNSVENFDIQHAMTVLDEDHYGLKEVKDRILEFLAVGKLRGKVEGKILCFVGPPGVGKTSIGKSIARALDRQFFRFSVGGLSDVAEIKGHRRTYVGAMPGKMIQAFKKVQTENPLILIDEVDKIGRGHSGDPASALLEMLDPEQNSSFLDHYVDCPVDLSRVLFVCTANVQDTIPAPLLDRMEVMEVSGYVSDEKMAIAKQYLSPQAKESSGLQKADVSLTKEAIETLIRYYCRESGVRKLKQHIEKVFRKAAFNIVKMLGEKELPEKKAELVTAAGDNSEVKTETIEKEGTQAAASTPGANVASEAKPEESQKEENKEKEDSKIVTTTEVRKPLDIPESVHVEINSKDLVDYVGPALYQKERIYAKRCPPGVSTGLGYLGNGSGAVMPVEVTVMPGNGNVQLTGKLGEVIRESAQIALSFIKTHAHALGLTKSEVEDLIEKKSIHLHMPEGAIGKEGPSAGSAILTGFLSLFSKTGIQSELAMTGEMTLAGQILPVGGLKEKILAAHRAGIKKIIAPADNRPDIEHNVPDSVKEGIEIVYAEDVRDVLRVAFAGTPFAEQIEKLPLAAREEVAERKVTSSTEPPAPVTT